MDNGILDPEYEKAVRQIIKYTDYLLGSGTDEFAYLGREMDWRANAESFVNRSRTVIVRNGAEGSYGFTEKEKTAAPAFPVKVEDTVGAGDVYNAGFISAVLEEIPEGMPDHRECSIRLCRSKEGCENFPGSRTAAAISG